MHASDFSFNVYTKNFFTAYQIQNNDLANLLGISDNKILGAVNQRLRLRAFYQPVKWFNAESAYDLSFRVQDSLLYSDILLFGLIDPTQYRYKDLDRKIYPGADTPQGSFGILQNLDRLVFTVSAPYFDIYAGRQSIAWGSSRVINPTDVIAPFTFDELDKEERIGVDALRLRVPLGMLSELDLGYVLGKDGKFENSAFFTRLKLYKYSSDISLMLIGFRENLLAGFDLARSIGGAGSWMELAYVWTDALKKSGTKLNQDYFRASLGMDYSFSDKSYAFVEYHYNGAGETEPQNYLSNYNKIAYLEGSVYLWSVHYLNPGLVYQISPLLSGTVQTLINLLDPSVYLALNLEYSIAQDIYLAGGAFLGFGKSLRDFQYQSEFGGYPNTFYTSFRFYF
jgi:hypothetical protein